MVVARDISQSMTLTRLWFRRRPASTSASYPCVSIFSPIKVVGSENVSSIYVSRVVTRQGSTHTLYRPTSPVRPLDGRSSHIR